MFLEFFRLREQPFGVTPDPRFLFPCPGHREALASLIYGIETDLGFGTLIAQPGMGKTTLLFHILEQYRHKARTAFIFNTQCNSYDLLRSLLSELEEDSSARDTFQLHEKFKQVLAVEGAKRRRVILVIDEAQNLGDMVMETVRLLSNFESSHLKLLHIILAGQSELSAKLSRPDLHQLQQRIPMITHLPCLSPQDIGAYIDHRLRVAGYQGTPLYTPEAVRQIVRLSRGIPREINRLCFNSLSLAYACSQPVVNLSLIDEVAVDLGLKHLVQQREAQQREAVNQQQAEVGRRQPVAVNAGPVVARSQPRPAEVWPKSGNPGPRRVERNTAGVFAKDGPRAVPFPSRPAAQESASARAQPFPVNVVRRRSTLPPIQRIRRVSRPSAWSIYKRPLGYAVLCASLIAAGWAAVTHWERAGSSATVESQNVSDTSGPSSTDRTAAPATADSGSRSSNTKSSVAGDRQVPPANAAAASVPAGDSASGSRKVRRRSSAARPEELLASAKAPVSPSHADPPPPSSVSQGPPVHEPTVAAQGQMEFVKYVRPQYPQDARNRHVEGTVVLSAVVAKDGTVKGIKPVSGDPTLLKAAETAIRDWVYRPYQINGRAVDVDTEIVINFELPRRLNP